MSEESDEKVVAPAENKDSEPPPRCTSRDVVEPQSEDDTTASSSDSDPPARDVVEPQSEDDTTASSSDSEPPKKKLKPNRCPVCKKKLTVVNEYECRCGLLFCSTHRYAEAHSCSFDYKEEGKRILTQANPVIVASKLDKI